MEYLLSYNKDKLLFMGITARETINFLLCSILDIMLYALQHHTIL